MFHTPAGDGYACQLRLESDSNAAMIAGSLRQLGDTFTAPLYRGMSLVFCIVITLRERQSVHQRQNR